MSFDVQEYAKKERDMYTGLIEASRRQIHSRKSIKITGFTTRKYKFVNYDGGYYVHKQYPWRYYVIKSEDVNAKKKLDTFVKVEMNMLDHKKIESVGYMAYDDSAIAELNGYNPNGVISNIVFDGNGNLRSLKTYINGKQIITFEESIAKINKGITSHLQEIHFLESSIEKKLQELRVSAYAQLEEYKQAIEDTKNSKDNCDDSLKPLVEKMSNYYEISCKISEKSIEQKILAYQNDINLRIANHLGEIARLRGKKDYISANYTPSHAVVDNTIQFINIGPHLEQFYAAREFMKDKSL